MHELSQMAVKSAYKRMGRGWDVIGDELRNAIIAREIVSIFLGWLPSIEVSVEELQQIIRDALVLEADEPETD